MSIEIATHKKEAPASPTSIKPHPGSVAASEGGPQIDPKARQGKVQPAAQGAGGGSPGDLRSSAVSQHQGSQEGATQRNLNKAIRQPIYANPPEYLKKENFGVKAKYGAAPGTAELPSCRRRTEFAEIDRTTMNIKNLCNQTRAFSKQAGTGRLLPVGIVKAESRPQSPGNAGKVAQSNEQPKRKSPDFYRGQLAETKCVRGKLLISRTNEPQFKIDRSTLPAAKETQTPTELE